MVSLICNNPTKWRLLRGAYAGTASICNGSEDCFMIIQRCRHPRCFEARPCKSHPKPEYRDTKTPKGGRFYSSSRWRKASERHRQREPLCRECKTQGRITVGAVTDHIVPISQGGDPWDENNHQTLCQPCHNRKRQRESRAG
jgi:5-methylcytosine-specific restriction endonuclease McrA